MLVPNNQLLFAYPAMPRVPITGHGIADDPRLSVRPWPTQAPPASRGPSCSRTAVPPTASFDTGGLLHGERAPPAADPGARLSVPEGLVGDEGHAHGHNQAEGGKG